MMKCYKCNQDSIKIQQHIVCEICGLDIDITCAPTSLYELLLYNEMLEGAYKLGRSDYLEDISENPYTIESDQIAMHAAWDDGHQFEEMVFENSGLTILAEKLNEEVHKLDDEATKWLDMKDKWENKYRILRDSFSSLFRKNYWWGVSYRKDLSQIKEIIKNPDN